MFGMFSAVSGQFTKGLVLGTLLPVLLFLTAAVPLLLLYSGGDVAELGSLELLGEKTTLLSIVVIAVTGLLYNLNTPLIRFYEGYPWKETRVGRWRVDRHRGRLEEAQRLQQALIALRRQKADEELSGKIQESLSQVSRVVAWEFPGASLVLPTRLGNVIRNFEEYPRQQYGISAISLWPRLVAVVAKEYYATIDEAKSVFDFFLNCSFLASALAALIALVGVGGGAALRAPNAALPWALLFLAAVALAYGAYLAAVDAAAAWGGQVKGAFDLYRSDLLAQLGYAQKPVTREEERTLWKAVSRQIVFGDPVDGKPLPYAAVPAPPEPAKDLGWVTLVRRGGKLRALWRRR